MIRKYWLAISLIAIVLLCVIVYNVANHLFDAALPIGLKP